MSENSQFKNMIITLLQGGQFSMLEKSTTRISLAEVFILHQVLVLVTPGSRSWDRSWTRSRFCLDQVQVLGLEVQVLDWSWSGAGRLAGLKKCMYLLEFSISIKMPVKITGFSKNYRFFEY